jgi:hypothetical protein
MQSNENSLISHIKLLSWDSHFNNELHVVKLLWEASPSLKGVFKSTQLTIKFNSSITLSADISAFIFLNVIVPCYRHTKEGTIAVTFPKYVKQSIIQKLTNYHNLHNISFIVPPRQSPVSNETRQTLNSKKYALFYGGGKDSLLSAAIHEDAYGANATTLLRLVWDVDPSKLNSQRELINGPLDFMSKRGFQYEYVESNYHAIVEDRNVGKIPNVALYPGLMAPLIAKKGYCQLSHGYDAAEFHLPKKAGGKPRCKLVRPEQLNTLSCALSDALTNKISFRNFNYGFNPGVAFKLLARAYPQYLPNIYMCERIAGKWCIKCRKCFSYALSCLAYEIPCDFNLGYFFQNSAYIKDLIKEVEEAYSNTPESIKYVTKFAAPRHLCSMVQIAHDINLETARRLLYHKKYSAAFVNLIRIIEPYKNFTFTDFDAFWMRAYEEDAMWAHENDTPNTLKNLIKRLNESAIPISSKYQFVGLSRTDKVNYNYTTPLASS